MHIKCLLTAAWMLLAQITIAQYTITGHVKDFHTNENLSGVSVYISDFKSGTTTDSGGNFAMTGIKKGIYLLEFSLTGYKSKIERITVSRDTVIYSKLSTAVAELNNVVVTAVSRGTELVRSPVIIKIIDKNYLNQNSGSNLMDVLKNVPGVSQITTGAAISKPIIRGLGYNRVITLYNGIRQEGQQWGDEHGVEIDEYSIDKIEIVKGPGSLMYGSDGIAGVINFISPKAPAAGQMKTKLLTNYQSNNHLFGTSLSHAGNKSGLQWLGRLSHKVAGNYKNSYDNKVYNSGFREYDGSLFLGINRTWGHTHLHVNSFNNILNLAEGERDSSGQFTFINREGNIQSATENDLEGYKTGYPHQRVNHFRIASNNYFILNKGTVNLDLGYQNNKRREYADVSDPAAISLFFDLNTYNYNVRYNFEENNGWETSVGIAGMQQSNINRGLEFLIPAYNLLDAGAYIFTQKAVSKKIILSGGIRFDNRNMNAKGLILDSSGKPTAVTAAGTNIKFNAFRENYYGFSGSAGMSWLMNETSTIKFNLSRGYRAPGISELASNGRHEGTFRYEIGNPGLKSEISHQIDLAFFNNAEHLTVELTPFVNFISNYIYAEKSVDSNGNDIIIDPDDPAPAFRYVQGNAKLAGAEIYVDFHPHPLDWLHIENSFSYVQATQSNQSDSTKNLPFIPAPKYRGELKAEFKKVGKIFTNCYVKAGLDHYFSQNRFYSAYATETKTPAYTLFNAGMGMDIKAFGKKDFMGVCISAENLTNRSYQNHLSRLKYASENTLTGRNGVFNMGRNISLKMVLNM